MIDSCGSRTSFFSGRLSACLLTLTLLMAVGLAPAQILTGTLTGTIKDTTDAVVPNASVTATDQNSGLVYNEKSNSSGEYTFPNLPNSVYKITVEFSGFAKTEVKDVRIDVSVTARVNIKLEIAKTGTEVVEEAQQTNLQSD